MTEAKYDIDVKPSAAKRQGNSLVLLGTHRLAGGRRVAVKFFSEPHEARREWAFYDAGVAGGHTPGLLDAYVPAPGAKREGLCTTESVVSVILLSTCTQPPPWLFELHVRVQGTASRQSDFPLSPFPHPPTHSLVHSPIHHSAPHARSRAGDCPGRTLAGAGPGGWRLHARPVADLWTRSPRWRCGRRASPGGGPGLGRGRRRRARRRHRAPRPEAGQPGAQEEGGG